VQPNPHHMHKASGYWNGTGPNLVLGALRSSGPDMHLPPGWRRPIYPATCTTASHRNHCCCRCRDHPERLQGDGNGGGAAVRRGSSGNSMTWLRRRCRSTSNGWLQPGRGLLDVRFALNSRAPPIYSGLLHQPKPGRLKPQPPEDGTGSGSAKCSLGSTETISSTASRNNFLTRVNSSADTSTRGNF